MLKLHEILERRGDNCLTCSHYVTNNADGLTCGCRFYPNGITNGYSTAMRGKHNCTHFRRVKIEELPPFALWILDQERRLIAPFYMRLYWKITNNLKKLLPTKHL